MFTIDFDTILILIILSFEYSLEQKRTTVVLNWCHIPLIRTNCLTSSHHISY